MDIESSSFLEDEQRIARSGVRQIFTPSTPIRDENLFKGRENELRQILQTLNTPGQHALLFGDRGVGKSSLANVACKYLIKGSELKLIEKRCSSNDTFVSIIEGVLSQCGIDAYIIAQTRTTRGNATVPMFGSVGVEHSTQMSGGQSKINSPSWVCEKLKEEKVLLLIDEFDSISIQEEKRKIAELIKQLSDCNSAFRIFIVGIAESAAELTEGHPSVQRCLKEIKLNKMSTQELIQILLSGATRLNMTFCQKAMHRIVRVSSGYPYFTHLLALKAAEEVIVEERTEVTLDDVKIATEKAIFDCENSLKNIYNTVTSYQNNMCRKILYSAALCNEEFIRAKDLRLKYEEIFGDTINQNTINTYLPQLVGPSGKIMKRLSKGVYRFADPRMVSYIRIAQYDMEDFSRLGGI